MTFNETEEWMRGQCGLDLSKPLRESPLHVWPMETPDVIAARVSFFDRLHGPQDFPDDVTTWSEWAD